MREAVIVVAAFAWRQGPRDYNEKMTSQNAPANAKRLLKALIDRGNPVAPDGRISQVAAQTGLDEGETRRAIAHAKARRGGSRPPNSAIPRAGFRSRLAVKPL